MSNNFSLGGYPPGAEFDRRAPFNQKENKPIEREVLVSITMSKSFKIKVSDYEVTDEGRDEDGQYYRTINYGNCNFKEQFDEQYNLKQVNLDDWHIDEMEVIPNE